MQEVARKKSASPWMHLLIAILVTPVTGVLVYWLSLYVIASLADSWQPAWFGDSSNAQIIVLSAGHSAEGVSAELIPLSNAAAYTALHPGSTFLIPVLQKDQVQERLKDYLKISVFDFEVKPLPDGQEEVTLYFMDRAEDTYGSRYKVSKDRVQRESYRYAADRGAIGVLFYAMIVTVGIHVLVLSFLLVRAIYLWRRKKRSMDVAMAGTQTAHCYAQIKSPPCLA